MNLKMFLVLCFALTGCVDDTSLPLVVDCGNGYFVQPPVSCPKNSSHF